MAKLVDRFTGEERELLRAVTLIGRAEYCDVCVPDPIVSREHARIRRRLTGYYIEDLGSTHGTRINNVRIRRRAKLQDGDTIMVARLHADGRPGTTPHPPHTDTAMLSEKTPPPGSDAAPEESIRFGAFFVFRK